MTKKSSFSMFVGFVLLIAGYSGWCGRIFYLRPGILRHSEIPPAAWTAIERRFPGCRLPPAPFDWKVYLRLLTGLDESTPTPASSGINSTGTEIVVAHSGRDYMFRELPSGAWSYVGELF